MDTAQFMPDWGAIFNQAGTLAWTFWQLVQPYVGLGIIVSAFLATVGLVIWGIPNIVHRINSSIRMRRIDNIIAHADNTEVYNPATGRYFKNQQEFNKWLYKKY